jgi:hypothetical protein
VRHGHGSRTVYPGAVAGRGSTIAGGGCSNCLSPSPRRATRCRLPLTRSSISPACSPRGAPASPSSPRPPTSRYSRHSSQRTLVPGLSSLRVGSGTSRTAAVAASGGKWEAASGGKLGARKQRRVGNWEIGGCNEMAVENPRSRRTPHVWFGPKFKMGRNFWPICKKIEASDKQKNRVYRIRYRR